MDINQPLLPPEHDRCYRPGRIAATTLKTYCASYGVARDDDTGPTNAEGKCIRGFWRYRR